MPEVLKTVGRYEALREVGRGGMAMVYLARQTDLDRFVALKELAAFHARDPSFAERFVRESRVAGSLSHPNIVTVHDYFEHDGTPYIAMEYVERGSLRGYVGRLSLAQVSGVFEGLLAGLAHAEQHGIVHRDLKPENLMVTAEGRVKIADFGIAKATTEMKTGAFVTATGHTVGTPTYMAPEQAMAKDVGPWTDLYSVGCMAFELFTGKVPFHEIEAPMAILLRHVNEEIPAVRSVEPSVDAGISDWIEHLLVKDPAERTRSAVDAWDEYEEIVIGLLGPRWRREARLLERTAQVDTPKPLTPAPFEGTSAEPVVSGELESDAEGAAGPYTPPEQPGVEPPPDPQVGPVTPVRETPDSDFVTFDGSAPAPPAGAPTGHEPEKDDGFESHVEPPSPPAVQPRGGTSGDLNASPPTAPDERPTKEPTPRDVSPPAEHEVAPTVMPSRPPPREPPAPTALPPPARGRAVAAILVVTLLLGALAYLVAPSEKHTKASTPDQPVRGEDVKFNVPQGWRRGGVEGIEGLKLQGSTAAAPEGGAAGEGVLAGMTSTTNPSLLPKELVAAVTNPPIKPQTVRVAAGRALLYEGLDTGTDARLTILALPTSKGVATLACRGLSCRAIAQTFGPRSASVHSPPPRTEYAAAMNRAMSMMAKRERSASTAAHRAKTARGLARALGDWSAAYRDAARAVAQIETAPFEVLPTRSVRSQLERLTALYTTLTDAAARRHERRYKDAQRAARGARIDLSRRLQQLKALGYEPNEKGST